MNLNLDTSSVSISSTVYWIKEFEEISLIKDDKNCKLFTRAFLISYFQILIQVCTDLTLCMLSLMMSETPTAMSHLLQAIGNLHEAGHVHVMQGILRLFLPQGDYL
jgi:hypothetical protein